MTTPVSRPSVANVVADHERRIRKIEFAPGPSSAFYAEEQVVEADTASVLFDSFPASLHVLELSWRAVTAFAVGDSGILYMDFNGDTLSSAAEDYRWRLSLPDPSAVAGSGGLSSVDESDSVATNTGGGIGYIAAQRVSWGHVRFPAYTIDGVSDFVDDGPFYEGGGGWCDSGGGSADPWKVAGKRDNGAILASIQIAAQTADGIATPLDLGAGSWFLLSGY